MVNTNMNSLKNRHQKSAFTLIELLVVIAIIAILAAILFPVFAQAREKARAITCISNQKQLSLAFMMYLQDYDETFPLDQYDAVNPAIDTTDLSLRLWQVFLYPYIKNGDYGTDKYGPYTAGTSGVWVCPSYPAPIYGTSYGANYALMPDGLVSWTIGQTITPIALASIPAPSDTMLLGEVGFNDARWTWEMIFPDENVWTDTVGNPPGSVTGAHYDLVNGDCDYTASQALVGSGTYGSCGNLPRYRHTGTSNFAFADGHVKAIHRGGINWFKNIYVQSANYPTTY